MKMPAFDYAAPETLAEALQILSSRRGEARVLAGGQSLLPLLAFRMAAPTLLVDLRKVPALDRIAVSPQGVELGAMVRWCDIEESEALKRAHPLLQKEAKKMLEQSGAVPRKMQVQRRP